MSDASRRGDSIAPSPSATTLLLESCSSITNNALSCRTLGLNSSTLSLDNTNASLIQKELELAEWLDRNIVDYRAALARRQASAGTNETATPTRQQVHLQQQELLDESVRQQQERLLLSRIEMSSIVQDIIFPSQEQNRSERDESETLLVQQVIKSRDEQVTVSLGKLEKLNHVRSQIQQVEEESQRLQNENRTLWQQLGVACSSNDEAPTETTQTGRATETRILKRALQDIIVGSDLDWYADKRLRETMMKLET